MIHPMLKQGLTSMASTEPGAWFPGHFGAAVIAAYFLSHNEQLKQNIKQQIKSAATQLVLSNQQFFPELEVDEPRCELQPIIDKLAVATQRLTESGHAVIYGSIALQALALTPELQTPTIVQGICRLLDSANVARVNRYCNVDDMYGDELPGPPIPELHNIGDALRFAFGECSQSFKDQVINGSQHFFAGEKIHGITHGHALWQLQKLGYKDLAAQGFAQYLRQLQLNRQAPCTDADNSILTPLLNADVLHTDYWKKRLLDVHFIKLNFSVLALNQDLGLSASEALSQTSTFWSHWH